ncbi:MAG: DUF1385 domain-containing protein [Ruminococcaceae bacterium]|nr:DUF1385 domain-containing protein [Oscillospiraceae bacterium]
MMRGPEYTAMAVRNPEGEIVLEKWETKVTFKAKFFKLPLIRGIFNFIDSLRFGYKCLMRSAEIAGLEDEEPKKVKKTDDGDAVEETPAEAVNTEETAKKEPSKGSSIGMNILMVISAVLGVLLAVGLFMWLPAQLYSWLEIGVPALKGNPFLRSLFEGVLRIVIFVIYMALVSRMKDIHRTFMYHGAEHKTIFCYEHGNPLTVENVKKEKRFHPRCGTSFMILMLLVGIIIGMFIPATLPPLYRTLIKLLLLPLTVGIGYELIKLAGRKDNAFTRIISAPGVWLQHLTTVEPDDDMIECAIKAFMEVLPEDEKKAEW